MNSVSLTGRLTRDPEVRYSNQNMAIARFTLAVDRPTKKDEADFIPVTCFGKTAELVEKYVQKGRLVGVTGRIQTGSYEKDGRKVYTTDVIADRVEFLGGSGNGGSRSEGSSDASYVSNDYADETPVGFNKLTEDDIPF